MEFVEFPKIYRVSRPCIITEKIDGTNAQIYITENKEIFVGSRQRWITPEDDNFSFAKWVQQNKEEILKLGIGRHYGEWWGQGIQRGYNLKERQFSLFNTARWCLYNQEPLRIETADPRIEKYQEKLPSCCNLVPIIYKGIFTTQAIEDSIEFLKKNGSLASPGFMKPEGVVCFHIQGNFGLKKTLEKDEEHKGMKKNGK